MAKYYIEKKGYGKHYYYKVKQASGKKLSELKDSNAKLFDSRQEALDHAMKLKKGR